MLAAGWSELESEIGRWRDSGRAVEFWWRDDDAARPNRALERLLALAEKSGVPLALAVIPVQADPALFAMLPSGAEVLQHGSDHSNRAAPGEKKTEYPRREPTEAALERLAEGRQRLAQLAGGLLLDVLAPPWNRIPPGVVERLATCGIRGLSRYGARRSVLAAPGVMEINTHVDIVDWKGGRAFIGAEQALLQATRHLAARREGRADAAEATGWLTHHACHDENAWAFLAELFERFPPEQGARWRSARELFTAGHRPILR
jgi:hypothetical protein